MRIFVCVWWGDGYDFSGVIHNAILVSQSSCCDERTDCLLQ